MLGDITLNHIILLISIKPRAAKFVFLFFILKQFPGLNDEKNISIYKINK